MSSKRILIATDIPFWRKSNGAHQRISALVRYLTDQSFEIRTFFLGQNSSEQFTENDKTLISQQNLDVEQRSSDQPPKNFLKKIGWYADATLNQLRNEDSKSATNADAPGALTLEDFRWPWAMTAMEESVNEFQPDAIIVEYIKLCYLLEALTAEQRKSILCLVDTHDVLHLRCQQFKSQGFSHWIEIDREEESKAVSNFDVVIAIQDEEAKIFRELSPKNEIIVCGHEPEKPTPTTMPFARADEQALTVGYLASTNASNLEAIQRFLREVWQPLNAIDRLQLVIAGNICEPVREIVASEDFSNVRLLGQVDALANFYGAVDLIINPVEFGTGLKIKTVEAVGYGKPVLCTQEGRAGLDALISKANQKNAEGDSQSAITVCDSSASFQKELRFLVKHENELEARTLAAQKLSQALFSDQQTYSSLKSCLLDGPKVE